MAGRANGIVLDIDSKGKIVQVLHNDTGIKAKVGDLFPTLLSSTEMANALGFLQRLKQEKLVIEVPMALELDGQPVEFFFTGVDKGDHLFLVATRNQGEDAEIYRQLAMVNNELANLLRAAVKQNAQRSEMSVPNLDQFTQLNNELVNTQRALSKSNRQLAALNDQKNELIGVAAHDLRNPISVISGYVRFVVGTGTNLTDDQKQMLNKAIDTSDKMLKMLEELLDISEIEAGKVNLKCQTVDLADLIAASIELNQVIADKKDIHLEFASDSIAPVYIDELKMEQVINNLISNAIKYSGRETSVLIALEQYDDELVVSVTDQGQGIPAGEVSQVFMPFSKTSVKSTGGEKSTGLGLAITKKIVEAHGGRIKVESEVGVGSCFSFRLSVRDLQQAPAT